MNKAHALFRLTEKIASSPQMMEVGAFDRAVALLEDRNNSIFQLAIVNDAKQSERELTYNSDTQVGIVSVTGPLTYLHYEPMCGESPTSYQKLTADVEAIINMGAKTLVLDIDSPGGEAYGVFEAARNIREMANKSGTRIISYVDGMAASAAYALASISDEIVMNPAAEVGSIGVVVKLRNSNKAMQDMGIQDTYVYAGKSKIPFNADGSFAESFLEDLQTKVNALYGDFTSHVASLRGISEQAVQDTEAKTFLAERALQLGLADKVMEVEEFYSYLSTVANGEKNSKMLTSRFLSKDKQEDTAKMQALVELQAMHSALAATHSEAEAQMAVLLNANAAQAHELATVKESLEQLQAVAKADAEAALVAKAEAEALAAQAKLDSRKAALSAVVAEPEVESLMASLSSLEDVAFSTVLASLGAKAKAVESSELFAEMGVSGQGDEVIQSDTAAILNAKYTK
jgi:signal peptide peptidase SppA